MSLHQAGRNEEAASLFRALTQTHPRAPAPWMGLAQVQLAEGCAPQARQAARQAVKLAPTDRQAAHLLCMAELAVLAPSSSGPSPNRPLARAWLALGLSSYGLDRVADAALALDQALRADPANRDAARHRALLAHLQGSTVHARAALRRLAAQNPADAQARLALAFVATEDGDVDEAIALLEPAPPSGPAGVAWRALFAWALLERNQAEAAAALLARIGEPKGDVGLLAAWGRLLLAWAASDTSACAAQAERLGARAADASAGSLAQRVSTQFNLGRFYGNAGWPKRAFSHYQAGHALLRGPQPFDRAAHGRLIEATMAAHDKRRLAHGPRARQGDRAPVFIVGLPRSGTTLAEQILAAHHAVHGAGERLAMRETIEALAGPPDDHATAARLAALDAAALSKAAAAYLRDLHALAPGAARIVDKMPANALHVGFIASLLPGARIIHCTRDPRDVGASIFQLRLTGYHPYAHDLSDLGWFMAQHARLMAHWGRVLPVPVLEVRLTDWSADFGATLGRVLHFLGLPYDAACETFHRSDREVATASRHQVREAVHARGIGRWRALEEPLAPMLAELER